MIFNRIRTEINKIDGNDGIFVAFTKIKVLSNDRLHLKFLSYFEDIVVHFRRVIRQNKHVYFIEATVILIKRR